MFKRSVFIFLAVLLALNFSACKNDSVDKNFDVEVSEEALNFKGMTVKIGTPNGIAGTSQDMEWSVEEKLKCKIEWVNMARGNMKRIINDMIAGKYIADITYIVDYADVYRLIRNNAIIPIDEYIDFGYKKYNDFEQNAAYINGRFYGVVADNPAAAIGQDANYLTRNVLYYSRSLIEELGLEDPLLLMEKGQWTWNTFLDMARRATADTDGDGLTDRWGMVCRDLVIYDGFVNSNNGSYIKETDEGLEIAVTDSETIEAFKFVSDLFNTYKVACLDSLNQIGYDDGSCYLFTDRQMKDLSRQRYKETAMDYNNCVLYPMGPNANSCKYIKTYGNFYAIPSISKNPEELAALLNTLFPYNNPGSKNFIDRYANMDTNTIGDFAYKVEDNIEFVYKEHNLSASTISGDPFIRNSDGFGSKIDMVFFKLISGNELTGEQTEEVINLFKERSQNLLSPEGTIGGWDDFWSQWYQDICDRYGQYRWR